jgi:hypothetical protein
MLKDQWLPSHENRCGARTLAQCHIVFPILRNSHQGGAVLRTAADPLVGLLGLDRAEFVGDRRVQGDPRRPGGLPHSSSPTPSLGKLNDIAHFCVR